MRAGLGEPRRRPDARRDRSWSHLHEQGARACLGGSRRTALICEVPGCRRVVERTVESSRLPFDLHAPRPCRARLATGCRACKDHPRVFCRPLVVPLVVTAMGAERLHRTNHIRLVAAEASARFSATRASASVDRDSRVPRRVPSLPSRPQRIRQSLTIARTARSGAPAVLALGQARHASLHRLLRGEGRAHRPTHAAAVLACARARLWPFRRRAARCRVPRDPPSARRELHIRRKKSVRTRRVPALHASGHPKRPRISGRRQAAR